MEHRWGARRQVALDVAVFHEGVHVAQCKSRDVSRGGMFVQGEAFDFPNNTPLELEVVFDNQETLVRFHLHAYVAHISEGGVGLMFKRTKAGTSQALMEILSAVSVDYAWDKDQAGVRRATSFLPLHPRAQANVYGDLQRGRQTH